MDENQLYHDLKLKIQELEKKNEFLQFIIDNSYDWELFRDTSGKIKYCSKAFEKITGYDVDDFISGKISEKDLVYPDDWSSVLMQMQKARNTIEPETDIEFRIVTKSG